MNKYKNAWSRLLFLLKHILTFDCFSYDIKESFLDKVLKYLDKSNTVSYYYEVYDAKWLIDFVKIMNKYKDICSRKIIIKNGKSSSNMLP